MIEYLRKYLYWMVEHLIKNKEWCFFTFINHKWNYVIIWWDSEWWNTLIQYFIYNSYEEFYERITSWWEPIPNWEIIIKTDDDYEDIKESDIDKVIEDYKRFSYLSLEDYINFKVDDILQLTYEHEPTTLLW